MKKTAVNMISGGAGYFLPMLINFLATPLLLKNLGPEAFGLQNLVNVILGYMMVADMGIDLPIIKFLVEYSSKKEIQNQKLLLNSTVQVYAVMGAVGTLIIVISEPYLQHLFRIPQSMHDEARTIFLLTGIGFLGSILCMWGKAVFVGIQRFDIANGVYIFFNLMATVVGLVLVSNGFGLVTFVLTKVIALLLSAITFFLLRVKIFQGAPFEFGLNWLILNKIKPFVGYGFALRASGLFLARLDQTFISAWVGISAVGFYSIPLLITTAVTGLIAGLIGFTLPRSRELFVSEKLDQLKTLYLHTMRLMTLMSIYFFVFLAIIGGKFIELWVGLEVFQETSKTLMVLCFAYMVGSAMCGVTNNFVISMNGMKLFMQYSIARSLTMILGFVLFIRHFGILGAAFGVLLGNLCDVAYLIFSLRNFVDISFARLWRESYLKPILVGLIIGPALFLLRNYITNWFEFFASCVVYSIAFFSIAWILKAFGDYGKEFITRLAAKLGFPSR